MATAQLDIIREVSAEEEGGQLISMTRVAQVTEITSTSAVDIVAEIYGATNMPAVGSEITANGFVMVLMDRPFKLGRDKAEAEVTLKYRNADLVASDNALPTSARGSVALQQATSQKDRDGNALTVTYGGDTVPVEINVLDPQSELEYEIVEYLAEPGVVARQWGGRVNSTTWQSDAAGEWLCTGVSFEPHNLEESAWKMTYSFQHNPRGHQPEGIYIDPETNQPPPDWQSANAFIQVEWHDTLDFNTKFPT